MSKPRTTRIVTCHFPEMSTFGTCSQLNNSGKQCYPMNRYKLCSSCIVESTDIARETVTENIEKESELESLMTNWLPGSNSDIKKIHFISKCLEHWPSMLVTGIAMKFKYFLSRSQSRAPESGSQFTEDGKCLDTLLWLKWSVPSLLCRRYISRFLVEP